MASNGRVVIPAPLRALLGLSDGDRILARVDGGALILEPVSSAVGRAQALVAKHARTTPSVVDELIAERRSQASRE